MSMYHLSRMVWCSLMYCMIIINRDACTKHVHGHVHLMASTIRFFKSCTLLKYATNKIQLFAWVCNTPFPSVSLLKR